jgi:RNA polymerase sigma-70 factor (sigma-E family)
MDARSEREFSEFVAARSMTLLRVAHVLTGDQHRAEDLVQGALTKLAARWHRVDDPDAYVRRVIYNDQVTVWRRRGKIREDPVAVTPDRAATDGFVHAERRMDLRAALSRLGSRQRAVLVLRFFEDLPEAEVARLLGCSVGTVRSQTHRALARLRTLAPELGDTPNPITQTATPEAP